MSKGKGKSKKQQNFSREEDMDQEMDLDVDSESMEMTEGQNQQGVPQQFSGVVNGVRDFVEGNPAGAAAIGAVVGGLAAGLLASERGRGFLKSAFEYARPMLQEYVRDLSLPAGQSQGQQAALPQ